jgi:hypothetical protein
MNEQPSPQPHDSPAARSSLRRQTTCPSAALPSDSRIEDYLDRVCAPLVESVPCARRGELRRELREHLEALAASYEEVGSEASVAVEAALQQFGDPRELARRYADEWRNGTECGTSPPIWPDLCVALGCFGLLSSFHTLLSAMARSAGHPAAAWVTMAITLPITAGLLTGLVAPWRPVRGALLAILLLSLSTPATMLVVHARADTAAGGWAETVWQVGRAFASCGVAILINLPLGCAGAALGSRLRALVRQRPRRWVLRSS